MNQVQNVMAKLSILGLLFILGITLSACGGRKTKGHTETGLASFYADSFIGRTTASGEAYDPRAMTAAHRSLPFGTIVRVTNLTNDRVVQLRINDRGPTPTDRILDVSKAAAGRLDFIKSGLAKVRVEVIE